MCWKRFCTSQDGSALVFVTITLPVIIGLALLVIDASRLSSLHNDLQKGADALALAGAAELDGSGGSRAKANLAITNLVTNTSQFSDSGLHNISFSDLTISYLKALPASDDTPICTVGVACPPPAYAATGDSDARYVWVRISNAGASTRLTSIFPATFIGGSNTANVSTEAVAGFRFVACDFTPVYICNPYDYPGHTGVGATLQQAAAPGSAWHKKAIQLRANGNNKAQDDCPGCMGLLESPNGPGKNEIAETIANGGAIACFSRDRVRKERGNGGNAIGKAIGVRFDLYGGGYSKTDPNYAPARNVRKGYDKQGNGPNAWCNAQPGTPPNFVGLETPGATYDSNHFETGTWDPTTNGYFQGNFGRTPGGYSASMSRYDVYKYEMNHDINGNVVSYAASLVNTPSRGGERGAPQCSSQTSTKDRRLLYGAVINCSQYPGEADAPIEAFASFFIINAPDGNSTNVAVELVDINGPSGSGTLSGLVHDDIQLYR